MAGRDLDIGRPTVDTHLVSVQEDRVIGEALTEVTQRLDEATVELKKIRRGAELALDEEIEEVE